MRIFQAIESSTNQSLAQNKTWYRNFYEPLIELGHEVYLFDTSCGRKALQCNSEKMRNEFSNNMVETFRVEHRKKKFDLCFFYLMDGMLNAPAIQEIKNCDVFTTNFSCNNIHQFYLVEKISHLFDLNLFAEKDAKGKFDKISVNSMWWPMASNPKYYHPVNVSRSVDVSFVGGLYGSRLENIYQLLLNGVNVHCYGPGWTRTGYKASALYNLGAKTKCTMRNFVKRMVYYLNNDINLYDQIVHDTLESSYKDLLFFASQKFPHNFFGPISDDDLIALYSKSKITLGYLEVFDKHKYTGRRLKHLHLRDFEAPMSGALYCTDYTEELAEMFDPKKEVIGCYSLEDRIDKIKYYLKNEKEGNIIRKAALHRARTDHTYQKRFQTLFEYLGFGK